MAENKRTEDVAERAENAAEKKEEDKFTKEQRAAIGAAGRTIVSASAGSGKTTVMIEKILRLIISGTDVKEILAVTFTNKAAAQMKDKLRREIIRAINRKDTSPEQRARLREQLADVPGADISTIHSFCSRLIRSHFFAAGVDGSFSVIGSDDAAGSELRSKALDELFEEAYDEGEEKFLRLLSVYWRKKSDNNLRKILLSLYDKLRERADYREFMQNSLPFTEEKFDRIAAALFSMLREKCDYYAALAEKEEEYFRAVDRTKSEKNAKTVAGALRAIAGEPDYFSACALPAKSGFSIPRKEGAKKDDSEEDTLHMARLAKICDSVKKDIFEDCAKVRSRAEELDDYLRSGEIAECLVEYLLRLDDRLWELKRERGVLDYNDLEHVALSLLSQPAVAEEMKAKYKYVFVDEYQDVNPVQEKILSAVSGENVFLVGDVKQSIYGFRGSKSEFFVRKQREFEGTEGASSLFLTRNFRSADAVLDAVNSQFLRAMTNETAGIDYAAGSVMERGGRYETNSGRVQVHIWKDEEKKEAERGVYSVVDSYLAGRKKLSEYGARVRRLIERERNREFFDPDTGKRRRAEYSDIAVLSRKKGGRIAEVIGALTEEGIPVASVAAVNICKYPEVETLIDILSLIDDEEQDIPLCSALLSAMGGLTAEDLARIRLACPDGGEDERAPRNFRDCCRAYAAEQKDEIAFKLNRFYGYLKKLRTLSAVQDAGELLVGLLAETNMEARLLSRDNGEECLRRIHRFIAEASEPEPLSVHAFLDRLRALGYDVEYSENGGENSVKVLTMHASKGLEYPVVILDDLSEHFHGEDRDEVRLDGEFGIAPRCYRPESMVKSHTLLTRLCGKRQVAEEVKDEMNLFYVALTRAKYALHPIFSDVPVMPDVKYARSFADFVDFSVWEKYLGEEEETEPPKQEKSALVVKADRELSKEIVRAFLWKYPYAGAVGLPVKSSASAVLKESSAAPRAFSGEYFSVPELFPEEDARETGTAYHAFLEHCFLPAVPSEEFVRAESERLAAEGALSPETLARIDEKQLLKILALPVFSELSGMRLYREQKFLVSLPAGEVWRDKPADCAKEEVLFQGALDLLAVSDGEIRIVDYKYSTRDAEYLREHYAPQLRLYRDAVAKIMGADPAHIRCTIVNIRRGFQTDVLR